MTRQEFLKAKSSSQTSELMDFMTMLHHNETKKGQGNKGEVFGKKRFLFTIWKTGILRIVVDTGTKRFYPHEN